MFLQLIALIACGSLGGAFVFAGMHFGIALLDRVAPMKHPIVPGGKG
jgi:hypothetical protein